jgi:uncharacterized protein (TIGR00369 family)
MAATDTSTRTHTVTFEDPMATAAAALEMSGLEFLQAIGRGELPQAPIARLMGFDGLEAEPGRVVFRMEKPGEHLYNPIGSVHGGVAATLLDSAMGCAVQSTLPAGKAYTSITLEVKFLRAITADTGPISCEAEIVHPGKRIATAQGRVVDENGKVYATGTASCAILELPT